VSTKRRKKGHGGGGGGGGHGGGDSRWLVTYADLLTVLMVLFLVLWTISSIDLKKFEKFKSGLGDFGNPAAAQASGESGGGAGATEGEELPSTTTTVEPGETTTVVPGESSPPTLTNDQLAAVATDIENALAAAGFSSGSGVKLEKRGLAVSVSTDGVLFDSGRAELTEAGRAVIAAIAPSLGIIANHVVIEGHTDSRPINGRAGYDNWQLSADRAVSVLKLLQNDFGISANRMAATGYGEYQPLDPSGTSEALGKNRRVEIVVLSAEAEAAASTAPAESTTTSAESTTTSAETTTTAAETTTTAPTTGH
jgi:chemotaxis protein MotB